MPARESETFKPCVDVHSSLMTTFYVVPDSSGYGSWAVKKQVGAVTTKVQDAQTQATAKNAVRRDHAEEGDQVTVYGSRANQIIDQFTVT